jgi:hypothetical protein
MEHGVSKGTYTSPIFIEIVIFDGQRLSLDTADLSSAQSHDATLHR